MSQSFARLLKYYRKRSNLSQAELARRIDRSPHFVTMLENETDPRAPSLDTLGRLVKVFATSQSPEQGEMMVDRERALDLMLSALELRAKPEGLWHKNLEEEFRVQEEAPTGSEVWIVTDLLAEAIGQQYAQRTARVIATRRLSYKFFVPFGLGSANWHLAIHWMVQTASADLIRERVKIYRLPDCAFSCRLRILNPLGSSRSAVVNLGPWGPSSTRDYMFVEAPKDEVSQMVRTLQYICVLEEARLESREQEKEHGDSTLGIGQRVFPDPQGREAL